MSRVMLVGISKKDTKQLETYFQTVGVRCESLPTIDAAIERLPADPPTLILAEKPDRVESLQSLRAVLKTNAPATPFLVTIPEGKVSLALEMMNAGAYDCLARPLDRLSVLAAAKRAALSNGRALFGAKVRKEKRPWAAIVAGILLGVIVASGVGSRWNGPPEPTLNLGSATLSGIQWDGRSLWVGNWMDATVTHYVVRKGFIQKRRTLLSDEIFRMQDSQPILVCNTPEALVTVGFDLKFRSHQRAVGLPTLQTSPAPGSNPTGLAWDGFSLWSVDGQTGLLYKHGPDLRVIDTVKSLLPNPVGLAWDGTSLWVMGGSPLRLARLERKEFGFVWKGPYPIRNFFSEGVTPSGMAAGFGRIWVVSGGTPHMISRLLQEIMGSLDGWK